MAWPHMHVGRDWGIATFYSPMNRFYNKTFTLAHFLFTIMSRGASIMSIRHVKSLTLRIDLVYGIVKILLHLSMAIN